MPLPLPGIRHRRALSPAEVDDSALRLARTLSIIVAASAAVGTGRISCSKQHLAGIKQLPTSTTSIYNNKQKMRLQSIKNGIWTHINV